MILVQLIDKPPIRRGRGTASLDVLEGLCRVEAVSGDEVAADDGDRAACAHRTVDEDARIGARVQRARDVVRRAREMRHELRERRVVQGNLRRMRR